MVIINGKLRTVNGEGILSINNAGKMVRIISIAIVEGHSLIIRYELPLRSPSAVGIREIS